MFPYIASPRHSEHSPFIDWPLLGWAVSRHGLKNIVSRCSLCRVFAMWGNIVCASSSTEYSYTTLRKGFTQMLTSARLGVFRNGQTVQICVLVQNTWHGISNPCGIIKTFSRSSFPSGQGGRKGGEGKKIFLVLPQATPMRVLPPGINTRIKGEKQKNLKLVIKELPMLRTSSSSKCLSIPCRTFSIAGSWTIARNGPAKAPTPGSIGCRFSRTSLTCMHNV